MIWFIIGGFFVVALCYFVFHLARFDRASNEGLVALQQGHFDQAEQHLQRALKIAQNMAGRSDTEVVAWRNLSKLSMERGQYEEAIERAGKAIKAMKHVACSQTSEFYRVFAQVADILEQNGEFEDEVQCRRLVVEMTPAVSVKDADNVTLSMIHLARALKRAERPAEAVAAYESVCKLPQSSNVAHARMEMANLLKKLGKHAEAEYQSEQAIDMFKKAEGDDGANVAIGLSNLGVLYSDLDRFDEALNAYQQSLEIRRKQFGETSSRYALTQNNCANCLRKLGRLAEAESMAEASIVILRADNHRVLPNALDTLGLTKLDAGRNAEAELHFAEACAILKSRPDRDAEDYRQFSENHAEALDRLGRSGEAIEVRAQASIVNEARKSDRRLAAMLDPILNDVR